MSFSAEKLSWGRTFSAEHNNIIPHWRHELTAAIPESDLVLPYGLGRSYGDACLNDSHSLIHLRYLDKFISFDEHEGILHCEAGVSLADILQHFAPRGWFVPVLPGTKHVSVGGAIANDIHGKNHHQAGTFGCHVTEIEVFRSDGSIKICSPNENHELFAATIAGLGLTGIILSAKIKLRKIGSQMITSENLVFNDIDEFLKLNDESQDFEYTVAWIDSTSKTSRGVFMRGNHSEESDRPKQLAPLLTIPKELPNFLLNRTTIKLFNEAYFFMTSKKGKHTDFYNGYFFPLDVLGGWNKIYGSRGFFQFQFVIPSRRLEVLKKILGMVYRSKTGSFLSVLKKFGEVPSPGMLSFPAPGLTLALDFPNDGVSTKKLIHEMEELVVSEGGRIYPAKDSLMKASSFQVSYANLNTFKHYIDPKFSSSFWRRVSE